MNFSNHNRHSEKLSFAQRGAKRKLSGMTSYANSPTKRLLGCFLLFLSPHPPIASQWGPPSPAMRERVPSHCEAGEGIVKQKDRRVVSSSRWYYIYVLLCFCFFIIFASSALASSPAVDPVLCRALTQHTPRADVAYQDGVDVHGKAVAPADLPDQPQIKLPDQIKIPLTINLAKTLNLNTSAYPYNKLGAGTEAQLGELVVEGSSVLFNGKPISDAQQERLSVLCLKAK